MTAKNLFDIIDYKFFQVFAGENRKTHAEIIMVITNYFKRNHSTYVLKEDLINYVSDYIKNREFEVMIDEEGNDITSSNSRDKALAEINMFKRNGWLLEEPIENYETIIQFDENALIIIRALEEVLNSQAPREYTGYLYVINNLLRNFDYSQGISILEQIYENTETLMSRLRGLNSSIKKYFTVLLRDESNEANKRLRTLLVDYQENVVSKAFNNLKLSDNPSKFRNSILNALDELGSPEGMTKLLENYKKTKSKNIDDKEALVSIRHQIDYVYDNISLIQHTISLIDNKNAKYIRSSTSKINFILSESYDISGIIESILKKIKYVDENDLYEECFSLYKSAVIDENSMYKPRDRRTQVKGTKLTITPTIDEEYVSKVERSIFQDNKLSKKDINEYIANILRNRKSILSSELNVVNFKDAIRLLLIEMYGSNDNMCYFVTPTKNLFMNDFVEYYDFEIIKRGDCDD